MGGAALFLAAALAFLLAGGPGPPGSEPPGPFAGGVAAMGFEAVARSGAVPLAATVSGRVVPTRTPIEGPGGERAALFGQGFRHQWPGVQATARFRGESLIAAFDDDVNRYRIVFDDETAHLVDRPGRRAFRFDGLGQGPHQVRLEKMSESFAGVGAFAGFFAPAGGALDPPPAPGRRIEFVGDSDLVGYGLLSRARDCTGEEVLLSTDTQRTYGAQVARRFGADHRIIAHSGIGVVRNYDGAAPGTDMPRLYPRVLFDDPAPPEPDGWAPQILVLALGTNDFATPLRPGERWPDRAALRADFERAYARFVADLLERDPEAFVLIAVAEGQDADYEAAVLAVAEAMREEADGRLDVIAFPRLDNRGCHWHPSLRDHAAMAETVSDYVELRPGLWRGR